MHEMKSSSGIYLIQQNTGQIFPLDPQKENVIGRSLATEGPTILLAHPAISKTHAVIQLQSTTQRWTLQNLSRNGSMINGKVVANTKILTHGDEITVGPYKLIFYENLAADEGTMEMPVTNDMVKDGPHSKNYWDQDDSVDSRMENAAIIFFIVLSLLIFAYYFLKR